MSLLYFNGIDYASPAQLVQHLPVHLTGGDTLRPKMNMVGLFRPASPAASLQVLCWIVQIKTPRLEIDSRLLLNELVAAAGLLVAIGVEIIASHGVVDGVVF